MAALRAQNEQLSSEITQLSAALEERDSSKESKASRKDSHSSDDSAAADENARMIAQLRQHVAGTYASVIHAHATNNTWCSTVVMPDIS